ncbi:MAG: VOC family protein [Terracidiphilus sp.]
MTNTRWLSILALAFLLAASPRLRPQAPAITGIAHVAYRVSDLDREVGFLGKLGFEEAFAFTSGDKMLEVFVKVNDDQFIEVYPQAQPSQPTGWMHVCYESDALDTLNSLYVANGLAPTKVAKAAAGNLIFSLKDPEGRITEFTQYMPGSRHTLDRGQHLGENRISDEILGFELPVANLPAARQFYVKLGFDVLDADGSLHLSTPRAPDLRIVLHAPAPGSRPQLLLPVRDARKSADQLRHMGLKVVRQDKLVFVNDPDGNPFVLLETRSARGLGRALSWIH